MNTFPPLMCRWTECRDILPIKRKSLGLLAVLTSLLVLWLMKGGHAWGPHSKITRAACATLPPSDHLTDQLVSPEALEEYCWLGDYRGDAFETYYPDDYLLFPKAPRYFNHALPDVLNTYEPFFNRALQAMRTESPQNAARWVGSLLHFQQDSGSPPHALPIVGELHTRLENWVDARAIQLGDYQPRLLGKEDRTALEGFRKRMDELIQFSRARAERARPFSEANDRVSAEPIILESALETSRVTADLLHTLLVLSDFSSRETRSMLSALTVRVIAPPLLALPKSPVRLILLGTDFSTIAEPIRVDDNVYVAECVFCNLPPGDYHPLLYRTGCKAEALPNVRLRAAERRRLHVRLESDETPGNLIRDPQRKVSYSTPGQLEHWRRVGAGERAAWETATVPVEAGATYRIEARLRAGAIASVSARWDQYAYSRSALRSDDLKGSESQLGGEFIAPTKSRLVRLLIFTQRPLDEVLDHASIVKDSSKPVELDLRYLRGDGQLETEIRRRVSYDKLSLESVTYRDTSKLVLMVIQSAREELLSTQVIEESARSRSAATAVYRDGKVTVELDNRARQVFESPPKLICTSAPDWTDTVMLCLKYDRVRGGRQQFPALWFHPTQPAQQTTFTVERVASERMQWGFLWLKVNRLLLTIRNGNRYMAWATEDGRMIKLTPIGRDGVLQHARSLYLEGYEAAARELR